MQLFQTSEDEKAAQAEQRGGNREGFDAAAGGQKISGHFDFLIGHLRSGPELAQCPRLVADGQRVGDVIAAP